MDRPAHQIPRPYANLLPEIQLSDARLYSQLSDKMRASVDRVVSYLSPIIKTRPIGSEEFTDHDLAHSIRILKRIEQILPKDCTLTASETYILVLGAILHDTGMWISKKESHELLQFDSEFLQHFKVHSGDLYKLYNENSNGDGNRWVSDSALTRAAASYARSKHPERLGTSILDPSALPGITLRSLIGNEYVDSIVTLSVSHSWSWHEIVEDDSLRAITVGFDDAPVELRFLSFLLRLGDLLDFGQTRISPLLWRYLEPINVVSQSHWTKEANIKLEMCDPNEIRISGHFDIDKGGTNTAEAYRLSMEWIGYIKKEIQNVGRQLNLSQDRHLKLGRLHIDDSRVKATGLAMSGQIEYEFSREEIIRLLGRELYSGNFIFVRELIQNSADATRLRQQIDNVSLEKQKPQNELRIDINISTSREGITKFTIRDWGTGMDLNILKRYFLQVGRTFYTEANLSSTPDFSPISRFGIGFLSCLLVAERIEVTTKAQTERKALRLTMQTPSECFLVENILESISDTFDTGTEVTVYLELSKLRIEDGDYMPIRDPEVAQILGVDGDEGDIISATKQYSKFLDIPVVINGVKLNQTHLTTCPIIKRTNTGAMYGSSRVFLRSEAGSLIAAGALTFLKYRETGLPHFNGKFGRFGAGCSVFLCARGMYVNADVNVDEPCLALNLLKGPRNLFTAGREVRREVLRIHEIKRVVIKQLLRAVFDKICSAASFEDACIWRLSIRGNEDATGLPVYLPALSNQGVKWVTVREMSQQHRMFFLSPFSLPLRIKSWTLQIPCLGIPSASLREEFGIRLEQGRRGFDDCPLCATSQATVVLWPPSISEEELYNSGIKFFGKTATKFDSGINYWKKGGLYRTLGGAQIVSEDFIQPGDLPAHDEGINPWIDFGLNRAPLSTTNLGKGDQHNLLADRIGQIRIDLSNLELDVGIDFGNDWV